MKKRFRLYQESRSSQISIASLRQRTLEFVRSMSVSDRPERGFKYAPSQQEPVLYASLYAVLTYHLYQALDDLPGATRSSWLDSILTYQCDDGLFRDPAVDCPAASTTSWWGWHHLTLHALMAITALGGVAPKPFQFVSRLLKRDNLVDWLESRNWQRDAVNVSNEVQNIGVVLQYARDFQNDAAAGRAVDCLLDWLAAHQDPQTGSWGSFPKTAEGRSLCVQTGYHLWLLFFYDQREIRYSEQIIDLALGTQHKLGGFGARANSSACEDIDSIDPLVRISKMTSYRQEEVFDALARSVSWVLFNFNEDGGAVFRRGEDFTYGHKKMSSAGDESALFPTWFRTLSLAYLGQVLTHLDIGKFNWQFLSCPGHQFWSQ